jgi:hypothetical protein
MTKMFQGRIITMDSAQVEAFRPGQLHGASTKSDKTEKAWSIN